MRSALWEYKYIPSIKAVLQRIKFLINYEKNRANINQKDETFNNLTFL